MPSDSTEIAPDEAGHRLLIVELRGGLYALDSHAVREIVEMPAATRLPGAPPHIRGVVNLRGQLLTVIDLGHRLTGTEQGRGRDGAGTEAGQSPARTFLESQGGSIVVVTSGEKALGVLVDDVHEVQELPIVGAEREVLARANGLLTGVGRLGDEVVLVVDIPELMRQTLA
jgi:purine-binding chemotaxis protein CheW